MPTSRNMAIFVLTTTTTTTTITTQPITLPLAHVRGVIIKYLLPRASHVRKAESHATQRKPLVQSI